MRFIVRFAAFVLGGYCLHVSALQAGNDTVLHSFCFRCGDGAFPSGSLIAVDGTLYGTTYGGGAKRLGTVFSINPITGAETVVHSFLGSDGADPAAGLTEFGGTLYGTTYGGDNAGDVGTVYSINPATGAEAVVHYFQVSGGDGEYPYAALIGYHGLLYGTTTKGGTYGYGTVFSVDPTTGAETILHSFQNNGADGTIPYAPLAVVSGTLYGTTLYGGTGSCSSETPGCGTVFSINPDTDAELVLHSFQNGNNDGFASFAGLTNFNGTLYGTTTVGGAHNAGTIFFIDATTRTETVVYSFGASGKDGFYPTAGLTISNGTLYGTTSRGGRPHIHCQSYCGTVFAFDPASATETVLHTFCYPRNCTDGSKPLAGVVALNGTLYGTTSVGGSATNCGTLRCGTVFSVQLQSTAAKSKPLCSGPALHDSRSTPKRAHSASCR